MSIHIEDIGTMDFSDVAEAGTLPPVTPGEVLLHEFLEPMGISQYRLAKAIGVPPQRIGEIVAGKRAITADTDLRLCRFFGLSDGWWLGLQGSHDTAIARAAMGDALAKIMPWKREKGAGSISIY
jgi:antitoxin HigA-1